MLGIHYGLRGHNRHAANQMASCQPRTNVALHVNMLEDADQVPLDPMGKEQGPERFASQECANLWT